MPNENSNYLNQASEYWRIGQPLEAGRLIFENLPTEIRPRWAASILKSVVERTGVKSPPIEHILHLADRPSEWKDAHKAFSEARDLTLKLDKLTPRSAEQALLLQHMGLAELVAKVIYNATNPPDEFDEDSGWWVAVCLKSILDLLDDDDFSKLMWLALCNDTPKAGGVSDGKG
jgi:hypothetical protein